jgi:Glutaredoxin-like domain (DUF836)
VIRELYLYTAKNCPLCVEMQEQLEGLLATKNLAYHIIDIGGDLELQHRYGARIPVLVSGNKEICEVKLDLKALQTFLMDSD